MTFWSCVTYKPASCRRCIAEGNPAAADSHMGRQQIVLTRYLVTRSQSIHSLLWLSALTVSGCARLGSIAGIDIPITLEIIIFECHRYAWKWCWRSCFRNTVNPADAIHAFAAWLRWSEAYFSADLAPVGAYWIILNVLKPFKIKK